MRIVADKDIPGLDRTFARYGEVRPVEGRCIGRADLAGADALIVRSVTRVGEGLLGGTGVRFVGTATIGTDHLDVEWLERRGIQWVSAPGCNADGAAQYTLCMILLACRRLGRDFRNLDYGIVGRGNVGGRVQTLLQALGLQCRACDPPLAAEGVGGLVPMAALSECDVVSFHVPLTRDGPCPTWRMIDRDWLASLRRFALVVNAARGDVAAGQDLLNWLESGQGYAALDVWPGEPAPDPELIGRCTVATPHVAGYSMDGKVNGTLMVFRAFEEWARTRGATRPHGLALTPPPGGEYSLPPLGLSDSLLQATGIERDDERMRRLSDLDATHRGTAFDRLRSDYPPRRDFRGWRVNRDADCEVRRELRALGFGAPDRLHGPLARTG